MWRIIRAERYHLSQLIIEGNIKRKVKNGRGITAPRINYLDVFQKCFEDRPRNEEDT